MDAFSDVVHIALTLPTEIKAAAEAAETEAVKVFNDIESGAIIKDIENLPGVVVSEITAGWGEFTAGLVDDWNAVTHEVACFFGGCATATPTSGPCIPASATGVSTAPTQKSNTGVTPRTGPVTSSSTGVPPANLGIKTPSSPFESNGIKLCATAFLAVLGVAIYL